MRNTGVGDGNGMRRRRGRKEKWEKQQQQQQTIVPQRKREGRGTGRGEGELVSEPGQRNDQGATLWSGEKRDWGIVPGLLRITSDLPAACQEGGKKPDVAAWAGLLIMAASSTRPRSLRLCHSTPRTQSKEVAAGESM